MDVKTALKNIFGYDDFRGGQEEIVQAILNRQDVLGVMPTGAGKSLCYQLPAVLLNGVTLVISPLISLMKDQVDALQLQGIPAAFVNSTQSMQEMAQVLYTAQSGGYKLLYVAPERLCVPSFLDFARNTHIPLVAVDEAHCISQWGQDFRPSYTEIPSFLQELCHLPVLAAFTATATPRVREDILENLKLHMPLELVTGFDRPNLYFEVRKPKKKWNELLRFLRKHPKDSGIIYCATRKSVDKVTEDLVADGFNAVSYHAGLPSEIRWQNQEDFLKDIKPIVVATNAFGMGIDKSNVSYVVHYNMPKDLESYYQEAGRAGRDGSPAHCLLLYGGQDVFTQKHLLEVSKMDGGLDIQTANRILEMDLERLKQMTFYSTTQDCLRQFTLRYFGEREYLPCGHCGNCDAHFEMRDITLDAQKIISCVYRMRSRFGATMVINVLRGSENQRLLQLGLHRLSTYNITQTDVHSLRQIIDFLLQEGYLSQSQDKYSVLQLNKKSMDWLQSNDPLQMKMRQAKEQEVSHTAKTSAAKLLPEDKEPIFEHLRTLRRQLAEEKSVPAYVVFSDASLIDMSVKLPKNLDEFAEISGVGEAKLAKYGDLFTKKIREYVEGVNSSHVEERSASETEKAAEGLLCDLEISECERILKEIPISESAIQLSKICKTINEVLKQHELKTVSPTVLAKRLEASGYLEMSEREDGKRSRVPTQLGIERGIEQEERKSGNKVYHINLYPSELQKTIFELLPDIHRSIGDA
ncbi:MAG: DNA helicase RecQ [Tissierellia bacterium]|nr:DNA helicase RecQ [Tissierellia bacterium]